ncbi:MAG TPA: 16S rRNA (cytosine(1402)-N(4))-methyltransferase RsmH [Candidatus Saccharimonadales bacterium]|nr:16S rRNA (cytosine(1402)-N(4))-methyltransferase RsmH [Candidatus Saccharimonadales bacterium]
MPKQKTISTHKPVLLKEVLDCLAPEPGDSYLDLTAGYGGHARAVINAAGASAKAVLVDRDSDAVAALASEFTSAEIVHDSFLSTLERLAGEGRTFDLILADLGVSSPHLEQGERGFSFRQSGPLDMRMDERQSLSAQQIVNDYSEEELAQVLKDYGEEPRAGLIARAIAQKRPIENTWQLAEVIENAAGWRAKHAKTHPATRSFQAIRIAVNDEINQLRKALPLMLDILVPGGRLAVISFHSLEDRLVKQFLAEHSGNRYDAALRLLTKKPITASHEELVSNPRARSARLRAASKIKTNRKG